VEARPGRDAAASPPIVFGTSGWRGVLAEEVTFARARAVAAAVAECVLAREPGGRVLVAHDRRFLGAPLAEACARVLEGAGVRTLRAEGPLATPAASFAVRRRRLAGALVVTASHNPPEYQGLKVLVGPGGGSAPPAWTAEIARRANAWLRRGAPPERAPRGRRVDAGARYREALGRVLGDGLRGRRTLHVTVDALHGTGAGTLDRVLAEAGARVALRRGEPDPAFGGEAPDPVPERLGPLARAVRRGRGLRLGLATDGDADRFAAVDADGSLLSATDGLALLVDHLARTGRLRRGVAVSVATGSLVARVARAHGLAVEEHPIGFKHLTAALEAGRVDVAGEESGGFAWGPLARDKDGMLAGCLLAELVARSGAPLGVRLERLRARHGHGACGRRAVADAPAARRALARLEARVPRHFDGARVAEVCRRDGLRLRLDDGFVLWRASGTEPVLRVYAEAPGPRRLARRLRLAAARLGG
jgi:phosphomannomutase